MADLIKRSHAERLTIALTLIQSVMEDISAQPERKRGKWGFDKGKLVCSFCGARFDYNISDYCNMNNPKYCPGCGAEMKGEQE